MDRRPFESLSQVEPVGVGPSRLSTAPRSVPADLWRIFGGLCAIAGETALERFPRAGRITGEMSQKAAYELRRSLQPRIEAWSTLAALLR